MADKSSENNPKNLEQFICDHYQKEKAAGKLEATADLDDARIQNFLDRALAESRRMSKEVGKSQEKKRALHEELGGDRLAEWREEHAAQVLNPEQADRIRHAHLYCS